jgi:hypothetical protein
MHRQYQKDNISRKKAVALKMQMYYCRQGITDHPQIKAACHLMVIEYYACNGYHGYDSSNNFEHI